MATRRGGELSLALDRWRLLAKSLRPPPDKFHGLEDTETRFRRRELDLIANEDSRRVFRTRAATISEIRRWLDEHGYVEVETPVLQPLYGGALARPFVTHHNALDRDLYLRIATELYLKRLVVGGIDRVYELGKDFRNEGVSHKHNPEFTMLEWYEAYADYEKTAHDLELLVSEVAERVLGTTKVKRGEVEIDFAPPWRRITLREAILERAGIDIAEHPTREALARAMGTEPDPAEGWGKLVDGLLSREVEPGLIQPTFIFDYPVELSPFAKAHRSEEGLVERWEAFVGGVEIANSFSELNDPDEQRRRFEQQAARGRARRRGGAALRRDLRRGARTGNAADRRRRPRHRPPGDDADRGREPARSAAVPGDEDAEKTAITEQERLFAGPAVSVELRNTWTPADTDRASAGTNSGLPGSSKKRIHLFERFTERARQVVVLAQEEARTLKHNYIGTEHILLGLLREEEGLAARVLESLDITVERVRSQVVRIVGSGEEVTSGQIPFTPARQEGARAGAARGALARPQLHRHRAHPARPRA